MASQELSQEQSRGDSQDFSYISVDAKDKVLEAIALAPFGVAIWESKAPEDFSSELTLIFINDKGAHPSGKTPKQLSNREMSESLPELIGTSLDYAIRESMVRQNETEVLVRTIPKPDEGERVFRNTIIPIKPGLVLATFTEVTKETILERDYRTERRTGLATRAYFDDMLHQLFLNQIADKQSFGILFMDIDKFKEINDEHGHICGDEILSEAARRLRLITPAPALIARWGGDEFAILTTWGERENKHLADAVVESFTAPFLWGEKKLQIKISVGCLTKSSDHNVDFRVAMSLVDGAMYRAKLAGGNRVENSRG